MDAYQAQQSVEVGSRFLVSPVMDEVVITAANELGVACMPGCHTPTEMLHASRAGAQLCKLFPCPHGGPDWIRAVLGPMPYLKIVATNGADRHNAGEWIAAGAFAVGFVAPLFVASDIAAGRWDAIEERARQCLAAVQT
jgi:2-dehydro-3-deoxyphosphogluconate aldolase/(4S)-4-hydroxy-2-oxoglutarate aldolase